MKCRTSIDADIRTALQWSKEGKLPNSTEEGEVLWTNQFCGRTARYYTIEEVHQATDEELKAFLEPYRKHKREYQKHWREKKKKRQQEEARVKKLEEEREKQRSEAIQKLKVALEMDPVQINNPTHGVVFDVETTGLNPHIDEVLQLSIIDLEGNILFDSYIKPYWMLSWDEAEYIHGISSNIVKDAPYAHDVIPLIRGIFDSANLLVGYNLDFDMAFMQGWGINFSGKNFFDVMLEFAPIYGEWSHYYSDYKWQKLTTCAGYFEYDGLEAHDSLSDVKATLHCYKKLLEVKKNEDEINGE